MCDVWYMMYDVWCTMYDVMCDVWYVMCDVWCMTCDVWCVACDVCSCVTLSWMGTSMTRNKRSKRKICGALDSDWELSMLTSMAYIRSTGIEATMWRRNDFLCTHTHTHTHAHTHTYIYTHTHIYTYTHEQTNTTVSQIHYTSHIIHHTS